MPEPPLPEITDEDIAWVIDTLGLPPGAFSRDQDDGAREQVLKANRTLDVSACPGSGKTTLLVAKLAILARKWPYRRRGICVLSHTNVAKEVIEKRLGGSAVGQALLSHPHFVGTIHGFVNQFLALPCLRACGYIGTQFNTEIAGSKLWALAGHGRDVPRYLYKKISDRDRRERCIRSACFVGGGLDISLKAENTSLEIKRVNGSDAFKVIDGWKFAVLREGYAAYEDAFAFAYLGLKNFPFLIDTIRQRFPLLFLDEVQDNSEDQSAILHRIFMEGANPVVRQRFGDPDQAIFDYAGQTEDARIDLFPAANGIEVINLPNSHRFGPSIAKLAVPLSLSAIPLVGQGPKKAPIRDLGDRHAVFLFDDAAIEKVLEAFGQYLLETFEVDQNALNDMTFAAVGAVHRDNGNDNKPRHVGHYWPSYDPDISRSDPQPKTLLQYVTAGHRLAARSGDEKAGGEAFLAVEKLAEGLLRLARETEPGFDKRPRRRQHRYVLQLLEENAEARKAYLELVSALAVDRTYPSINEWEETWRSQVLAIVEAIAGKPPSADDPFLAYPKVNPAPAALQAHRRHDNVYSVENDGRRVRIRVGSIHSVKGETHTAVLVLETFNRTHQLSNIIEWLNGKKTGKTGGVNEDRLKLHYVAMTRPSHLLCLAMKRSTFCDAGGQLDMAALRKLKEHGWGKIADVKLGGGYAWL
jgi:superfamily I DNA/RNA helicase